MDVGVVILGCFLFCRGCVESIGSLIVRRPVRFCHVVLGPLLVESVGHTYAQSIAAWKFLYDLDSLHRKNKTQRRIRTNTRLAEGTMNAVVRDFEDTAPATMGPITPPMPSEHSKRPAAAPLWSGAVSAISVA